MVRFPPCLDDERWEPCLAKGCCLHRGQHTAAQLKAASSLLMLDIDRANEHRHRLVAAHDTELRVLDAKLNRLRHTKSALFDLSMFKQDQVTRVEEDALSAVSDSVSTISGFGAAGFGSGKSGFGSETSDSVQDFDAVNRSISSFELGSADADSDATTVSKPVGTLPRGGQRQRGQRGMRGGYRGLMNAE